MKLRCNLQPDRIMYTILMKIHSLFNDVHGSDEVLQKMIRAYNTGLSDCCPNEEAFITAMSTWEQSGRKDATDGAFRIFNDMIEFHQDGNNYCRPSLKTFGKLMVILAKNEHNMKVHTGQRILSEMKKHGVTPDMTVYNWYMRVCSTVYSKERSDRRESWTEALATFDMLRFNGMANSHTYNSIFHACNSLLDDTDEKCSTFRKIFLKCRVDGLVDRRILSSLKRFLSPSVYQELTGLDPRENGIQMKKIPVSWKSPTHRSRKK
mmetsp:Transcript_23271/g.51685  ORF Transcript_23271/g.51685 Transcript_23271/m.51685 type:complete len:264 (-) Transcript_23271:1084-1875(-)